MEDIRNFIERILGAIIAVICTCLIIAQVVGFFIGLAPVVDTCKTVHKRGEFLVPGYRLGCYLGERI